MNKVILSIDTTGDYLKSEIEPRGLKYIPMAYIVDDKPVYEICDSSEEFYAFFKKIETGAVLKTTQLNMFEMKEYFERILSETEGDIIHYTLSSGMSGTYQCAFDAAEELNKKFEPNLSGSRKIYVVDTLGATQTICHLVDYAIKLRDEGKTTEQIIKASEEFRDRQQTFITVNDLGHLKRGGRISGISAAVGTLLNIKPIIIINDEGKLIVHAKEMGIKKTLSFMVSAIKKYGTNITKQTIIVAHTGQGMCEYAKELVQKIKDEVKCEAEIKHIGTVIGTHLGPDALAIVFSGKNRLHK